MSANEFGVGLFCLSRQFVISVQLMSDYTHKLTCETSALLLLQWNKLVFMVSYL